jgi:hypothetical protein
MIGYQLEVDQLSFVVMPCCIRGLLLPKMAGEHRKVCELDTPVSHVC